MHVILLLQHYLSIIIIAKLRCVHVIVRTMISRKKTCMICTLNTEIIFYFLCNTSSRIAYSKYVGLSGGSLHLNRFSSAESLLIQKQNFPSG